jgi:tetrapyrrole methylase family protein/MazG family protein
MGMITIVGLGPGGAELITRSAWNWLIAQPEVYVRTRQHPAVGEIPSSVKVISFDDYYQNGDTFEQVYQQIVAKIIDLGERPEGVTYAVPGHPMVAEATSPEIIRIAKENGISCKVFEAVSFLEPCFTALAIDPFPNLVIYDAIELGQSNAPKFPASVPVLIGQIYSRQVAAEAKMTLLNLYPDMHPVKMVHNAGTPQQVVEEISLYEIDRSKHIGLLSALYLPPLGKGTSMEDFQELVAHLRAPDGCPWDKEQTHLSLRSNLLEETYEAITALDNEAPESLQEELGDLLLQIVLHAQIASENGDFNLADVLHGIYTKIVRRHPHVFGDVKVNGVDNILQNWEKIKEAERAGKGEEAEKGLLDGIPVALPALSQAQAIQERAGRVGFDWQEIQPVLKKVYEELKELENAQTNEEQAEELGDILFAVVNLVRWYDVDAESALRASNSKFRKRFKYIEQKARESGRTVIEMPFEEMDAFWEESKHIPED